MQQVRGKGGIVIGTITLCGMLGALAYKDWKEQKVSVYAVLVFIILGMIFTLYGRNRNFGIFSQGRGLEQGFWCSHGLVTAALERETGQCLWQPEYF